MRSDQEFWDDVVIATLGSPLRMPYTTEVVADTLLEARRKRHAQWQAEASVEILKALADSRRTSEEPTK